MVADFEKANPGITVKPVYSGNYGETLAKALTANKSGQPPQVAVLVASDALTVIDEDAVVADGELREDAPTTRRGSTASSRRS